MRILSLSAARRSRDVAMEYGRMLAHPRHICGYWWKGTSNFGDALSPIVLRWISASKVLNIENLPWHRGPVYLAVGSILDGIAIKNTVIWGTGFISDRGRMATEPRQVLAVRGPLSRQILLDQGIRCPDVYGDPGLLVKRMFDVDRTDEYEYGIVPHYIEKDLIPTRFGQMEGVNLIDVQMEPIRFIEELCRCKRILSSSLHGLITADAFGIPSAHFSMSDRVTGGDFKFRDYYESIGREAVKPFDLADFREIDEAKDFLKLTDVEPAIRSLLDASPFPSQDRRCLNV